MINDKPEDKIIDITELEARLLETLTNTPPEKRMTVLLEAMRTATCKEGDLLHIEFTMRDQPENPDAPTYHAELSSHLYTAILVNLTEKLEGQIDKGTDRQNEGSV